MKATAEKIARAEAILAGAERLPDGPNRAEVIARATEHLADLRRWRDDPADEDGE